MLTYGHEQTSLNSNHIVNNQQRYININSHFKIEFLISATAV